MEHKSSGLSKVRALNLANSGRRDFDIKDLGKMTNLHFLVLDGCNVSGDLGSISEELRWLQWRYIPMTFIHPTWNLANLISLDFSHSTMFASMWIESDSALEACPNLLKLDLRLCLSITTLPDSIRHLSRLKELHLGGCIKLQKLPNSIGWLTALQELDMAWCVRLEALPESIAALSRLQTLGMSGCSSISNLSTTFGLMTGLVDDGFLTMDLATEGQACALAQLNSPVRNLMVIDCSDEAIEMLDGLDVFGNLHHLLGFSIGICASMTKMPKTIGLLTNLLTLNLDKCEKLRKLPNSIGQLKVLKFLTLRKCISLETLPGSLGALTCLEELGIVECVSLTKLPRSLGHLSGLEQLHIEGCPELQQLLECVRQLDALKYLAVLDCGSLERMGVVRAVRGLRIWGCTSVTELPGSCLVLVDRNFCNPSSYSIYDNDYMEKFVVTQGLKELQVVEVNDCGLLHLVQQRNHGRVIWQRVHKLSRCRFSMV